MPEPNGPGAGVTPPSSGGGSLPVAKFSQAGRPFPMRRYSAGSTAKRKKPPLAAHSHCVCFAFLYPALAHHPLT